MEWEWDTKGLFQESEPTLNLLELYIYKYDKYSQNIYVQSLYFILLSKALQLRAGGISQVMIDVIDLLD